MKANKARYVNKLHVRCYKWHLPSLIGELLVYLQSLGGPDLSNYLVMDATDYTKRKHVFKLLSRPPLHPSTTATNGQTEILVQAENDSQMSVWRDLLKSVSDRHDSLLKKVRGIVLWAALVGLVITRDWQ